MTASQTRCTCCDLPLDMCGKQAENVIKSEARFRRARVLARRGVVESKYRSRCPRCSEWMPVGTPVFHSTADDAWVHADHDECK